MKTHRFYHVDRYKSLEVGLIIKPDENGLSRFGVSYWNAISSKSPQDMTNPEKREFQLEEIRKQEAFSLYTSRMQVFFGSNTIDDARRFYEKVEPKQSHPVPIYEIYASKFWTLDMNWLDYSTNEDQRINCLTKYWYSEISNHNPESGERRPPLLEVLMALPVTVGDIVEWL